MRCGFSRSLLFWGLIFAANLDGTVAQLHVSMTQWQNLFSLEVTGDRGGPAGNPIAGGTVGETPPRTDSEA